MRPLPGAPGVAAAAALLLLLLPRARSDEHEHTVRRSEPRGRPRSASPLAAPPGPMRPGGPLQPCGRPSAPSGRAWRGRIRGSWEEEAFSSTPGGLGLAPRLRLSGLVPRGSPSHGLWTRGNWMLWGHSTTEDGCTVITRRLPTRKYPSLCGRLRPFPTLLSPVRTGFKSWAVEGDSFSESEA